VIGLGARHPHGHVSAKALCFKYLGVQQRRWQTMTFGGTQRHVANTKPYF